MNSKISLERMRLRAFHGVLEEERSLGNDFLVDVTLSADVTKAVLNDTLEDTIDYSIAYDLVREQMRTPSKLLEHVAGRILFSLFDAFPRLESATVGIRKLNPPLKGDVESSMVEVTMKRSEWASLKS